MFPLGGSRGVSMSSYLFHGLVRCSIEEQFPRPWFLWTVPSALASIDCNGDNLGRRHNGRSVGWNIADKSVIWPRHRIREWRFQSRTISSGTCHTLPCSGCLSVPGIWAIPNTVSWYEAIPISSCRSGEVKKV